MGALRAKIVSLGGEPAATSGMTGAWKRLLESGAVAIGEDIAVRVLEREEDHVALAGEFFREAAEVINGTPGGPPDRTRMAEIMRRHGITPAPPPT